MSYSSSLIIGRWRSVRECNVRYRVCLTLDVSSNGDDRGAVWGTGGGLRAEGSLYSVPPDSRHCQVFDLCVE